MQKHRDSETGKTKVTREKTCEHWGVTFDFSINRGLMINMKIVCKK